MSPEPAALGDRVEGNQLAEGAYMRIGDSITNTVHYHLPHWRRSYHTRKDSSDTLEKEGQQQRKRNKRWYIAVGVVFVVAGIVVAIALPLIRSSQIPTNPTPSASSPTNSTGRTHDKNDGISQGTSSTPSPPPASPETAAIVPTRTTPSGSTRPTTTAVTTRYQGKLVTGLAPGARCTADSQCLAPNFCYTETHTPASTTCCASSLWGCPGASCGSHDDCLDPFPCHTPTPGSGATCCGYPPWTWRDASCWSTPTATATKAA